MMIGFILILLCITYRSSCQSINRSPFTPSISITTGTTSNTYVSSLALIYATDQSVIINDSVGLLQINSQALNQSLSSSLSSEQLFYQSVLQSTKLTVKQSLIKGESDVIITSGTLNDIEQSIYPDVYQFPFSAVPIVPIFNLIDQSNNQSITDLALSGEVLYGIFINCSITRWNHPLIQSLNPSINLPDQAINVVLPSIGSRSIVTFLQAIYQLVPSVNQTIIPSTNPVWPLASYASYRFSRNAAVSVQLAHQSIGFTIWHQAVKNGASIGRMISSIGEPVSVSIDSLRSAVFSGSSSSIQTIDLSSNRLLINLNAVRQPNCWPIVQVEYGWIDLSINQESNQRSCTSRDALKSFLLWLLQDSTVNNILVAHQATRMFESTTQQMGIIDRITNKVTCMSTQTNDRLIDRLIVCGDDDRIGRVNSLMLEQYNLDPATINPAAIDHSMKQFVWRDQSGDQSIYQTIYREISFAAVFSESVTPRLWDAMVQDPLYINMPVFLFGVEILFNRQITPTLLLDPSFRIIVTLELFAGMVFGNLTDWADSRLLAINPALKTSFLAHNITSAPITIVTSCLAATRGSIGHFLTSVLADQLPAFRPLVQPILDNGNINVCTSGVFNSRLARVVTHEKIAGQAVTQTPGGVGYQQSEGYRDKLLGTLDILHRGTVRNISVQSMIACSDALDVDDLTLAPYRSLHPDCYPFTQSQYVLTPTEYTTSVSVGPRSCTSGRASLEYVIALFNQSLIDPALATIGVARVVHNDELKNIILDKLFIEQPANCDGQPLFALSPIVFQINESLQQFAYFSVALGGLLSVLGFTCLAFYHKHPVVQASKIQFVAVSTIGICCLLGCVSLVANGASDVSCSMLLWLVNIGSTCLAAPLFLKTFRRYVAWSALRARRPSSQTLSVTLIAVLTSDVIMLAIWECVSSWKVVMKEDVTEPLMPIVYQECGQPDTGMPLLISIGLVKLVLLAIAGVMGFALRHVSSPYNEQKHVSLIIYIAIGTLVMMVPISVSLHLVGDNRVVVVTLGLLLISYSAWALIYLPKFLTIIATSKTKPDGPSGYESSQADLVSPMLLRFDFTDLPSMNATVLQSYIGALQKQGEDIAHRLAGEQTEAQPSNMSPADITGNVSSPNELHA